MYTAEPDTTIDPSLREEEALGQTHSQKSTNSKTAEDRASSSSEIEEGKTRKKKHRVHTNAIKDTQSDCFEENLSKAKEQLKRIREV